MIFSNFQTFFIQIPGHLRPLKMCISLTALNILYHASSVLSSSGWSSFLDCVCWIYNLMHCFLDLLRSKMASWLSREGAGVAGLVHVWNPLVNRACCLRRTALPLRLLSEHCSHYTSFFKHLLCILDKYKYKPIGQPRLLRVKNCSANPTAYATQAF